jgi:hypothetical protein
MGGQEIDKKFRADREPNETWQDTQPITIVDVFCKILLIKYVFVFFSEQIASKGRG